MSGDTLRDLSQNPIARRIGVPRIPTLRRYEPGQPLLDGPALVGELGNGRFTEHIRTLLKSADTPEERQESHIQGVSGPESGFPGASAEPQRAGKVAAVVLDASGARTIDDLAVARGFLQPAVRRLAPSGRLLVIAPEPDPDDVEAAAVASAFDGIVRSAAKEVRAGATANLLVAGPDVPPHAASSAVRFLLSARSAYVDGQVVHVSSAAAAEPTDPPLSGRVAVVTGAARGIGAAIADTLARDGATVVAVDIPAAGEALARVANRTGGTALQLDITAADAAQRLIAHVRERHGRLDVMVHNAGITRDKLLANMDADRWDAVLAVNLAAQLTINDALLDSDVLGDSARFVCISSTSGIAGNRGQTNYAASKAGVIGMVRALAPKVAGRGATVNAIAPGFIETEMTQKMPLGTREAGRRINSLRQGGLPVDVAEVAAWLGQACSGGITGQVVRVCGQSMLGA